MGSCSHFVHALVVNRCGLTGPNAVAAAVRGFTLQAKRIASRFPQLTGRASKRVALDLDGHILGAALPFAVRREAVFEPGRR